MAYEHGVVIIKIWLPRTPWEGGTGYGTWIVSLQGLDVRKLHPSFVFRALNEQRDVNMRVAEYGGVIVIIWLPRTPLKWDTGYGTLVHSPRTGRGKEHPSFIAGYRGPCVKDHRVKCMNSI